MSRRDGQKTEEERRYELWVRMEPARTREENRIHAMIAAQAKESWSQYADRITAGLG